jgi:hypothetical protein
VLSAGATGARLAFEGCEDGAVGPVEEARVGAAAVARVKLNAHDDSWVVEGILWRRGGVRMSGARLMVGVILVDGRLDCGEMRGSIMRAGSAMGKGTGSHHREVVSGSVSRDTVEWYILRTEVIAW